MEIGLERRTLIKIVGHETRTTDKEHEIGSMDTRASTQW